MTYGPKIEGVRNGNIRQTIRRFNPKRPFEVGDKLLIHGWVGAMYRTPWNWRREEKVRFTLNLGALETKFVIDDGGGMRITDWEADLLCDNTFPLFVGWYQKIADDIAIADGILPPTGIALKEVLEKFHGKFTDEPVRFQVIRW
jgi:hypothetical protein